MTVAGTTVDPVLARSLRRYIHIGEATGGFVFLLGMALLIHGVGWSPRPLPYALFGGVIAVTGIIFIRYFHRSATRQQWIFRFGAPHVMRVSIDAASDDEGYEARLFEESGEIVESAVRFVIPIQTPHGDAPSKRESLPCMVHFDPESGLPAVIHTEEIVHWAKGERGMMRRKTV